MKPTSNAEFAQMLEDFANNPTSNGWCPIWPETLRETAQRLLDTGTDVDLAKNE